MSCIDTIYGFRTAASGYVAAAKRYEPGTTKPIRHALASMRKAVRSDIAETVQRGYARLMVMPLAIGTSTVLASHGLNYMQYAEHAKGLTAIGGVILASGLAVVLAKKYDENRE